jgi:hypothetical protein
MPKTLPDRIAALKAKKDKLAERLNALESKAKTVDRKRETRRKIVIGGAVLVAMEKDQGFALQIRALLSQHVGRAIDREAIADLLTPPAPAPVVPLAVLGAPVAPVETPTPATATPSPWSTPS